MRLLLAIVIALPVLAATPAPAQTMSGDDRAYTLTLMCAVVAAHYKVDADIQRTMDASRKMGRAMGYSDKRVTDDLWNMTNALGIERRTKPNAMENHRATCRRLKLVS